MVQRVHYDIGASSEVLLTSESGDRLTQKENIVFNKGQASGNVISIYPDMIKQTVQGIGTSFTESAAYVLAHLNSDKRAEVMQNLFAEDGANFSMARTPIGSCDFCVEGKYSYAARPGDTQLNAFDIGVDRDGFDPLEHAGIKDSTFDLLPMIKQALEIKQEQPDPTLSIIASAWTAPPWMKDIEDWYQPGSEENDHRGGGGCLKPEFSGTFADYLVRYLDAYKEEGVDIWGLTPINEPLGNNGQWESMHFTPESQRDFIKHFLGPKLHKNGYQDLALLMLDHSRDHLAQWADVIYGDPESAGYVHGAAVHWYESTFKVYEDVFDRVHDQYPQFSIIHTEGCIDDLGKDAPEGVLDPVGYKESDWFDNDEFWWNDNASDWAYSVTWPGVNAEDHTLYTPVHRYARNIIVSLDHWVSGWIDWNMVLDRRGGPNHVGNYCGAPIMIDTDHEHIYYTPVFYVLAQLSRTIRPGDRMLGVESAFESEQSECVYSCASINDTGLLSVQVLNTSKNAVPYALQIGNQYARVTIDANALSTIRINIHRDEG